MKWIVLALLPFCKCDAAEGPAPTAAQIMMRVAANQDREQKARNEFVYEQKIHRTMRNRDGKLLREEFWTYSVIPAAKGSEKKLISVKGRYRNKGKLLPFEGEPVPNASLLTITLDDANDKETRDGIDRDLFPLTSEEQKKYAFICVGEKMVQDRPVYQIQFRQASDRDYGWTGEALIDKEEFQPVSVYTKLSRRLPMAVRTMLGTDVPGLGFSVRYTRVDKDLWFPASYGSEFGVHALFMLNRTLTESLENMNFRRVAVESRIEFGEAVPGGPPH